jgi:hypothetical protein
LGIEVFGPLGRSWVAGSWTGGDSLLRTLRKVARNIVAGAHYEGICHEKRGSLCQGFPTM